jgi:hypothetical protein
MTIAPAALLGALAGVFLAINVVFAAVYFSAGGLEGVRAGRFSGAFYFSVQTLPTTGYGAVYPVSQLANCLACVEILIGLLSTALATGILCARLSRPQARVLFSRVVVIRNVGGVKHLTFRLGNERRNQIIEARISVTVTRAMMRILTGILLSSVTGCAIPRINPPPVVTTERSWVPDDVVIYGQDLPHGFFRFALDQAQPQPLGDTRGFLPEALFISPDKTEVYADANGPGTFEPHYIYNAKTHTLRDLGHLMAPFTFEYALSPDWHYLAWSNFRDPGEHIIDLRANTVRTFQLVADAHWDEENFLIDPTWAADGSLLLTSRPLQSNGGWEYWKLDPISGASTQIAAAGQPGNMTYQEGGQPVPLACGACTTPRVAYPISTPSGAAVYISKLHDLVVKDPDGTLNIVAKHVAPPPEPAGETCFCGTPQGKFPAIWTVFDGDIVLYSFGRNQYGGNDLWIYGIAEHKVSQLGVGPIELVF